VVEGAAGPRGLEHCHHAGRKQERFEASEGCANRGGQAVCKYGTLCVAGIFLCFDADDRLQARTTFPLLKLPHSMPAMSSLPSKTSSQVCRLMLLCKIYIPELQLISNQKSTELSPKKLSTTATQHKPTSLAARTSPSASPQTTERPRAANAAKEWTTLFTFTLPLRCGTIQLLRRNIFRLVDTRRGVCNMIIGGEHG
jgi:hypothetical protein